MLVEWGRSLLRELNHLSCPNIGEGEKGGRMDLLKKEAPSLTRLAEGWGSEKRVELT